MIDLRQSTPHHVLTHQESLRRHYALPPRALTLGWRPEDLASIDADVSLSAAAAQHREGFTALVTQVTRGPVGLILSSEVTRRSRTCSDGYPRLDICGDRRCVIADRAGVYAPAPAHGRVWLGLTGPISEMARHTLRARLTAGLLHKAQRGELALPRPVGLCHDARQRVQKDPDLDVQHRLDVLFTPCLPRHSASQVLRFFKDHACTLPRRDLPGALVWKQPTVAAMLATLTHPASARACVSGRTRQVRQDSSPRAASHTRRPMHEWNIRRNETSPASLSGETCATIQGMRQDHDAAYDRNNTRGIPRPGAARLHGIVSWGACGHKLLVQ